MFAATSLLGSVHDGLGEHDLAVYSYLSVLRIAQDLRSPSRIADAYGILESYHQGRCDYTQAALYLDSQIRAHDDVAEAPDTDQTHSKLRQAHTLDRDRRTRPRLRTFTCAHSFQRPSRRHCARPASCVLRILSPYWRPTDAAAAFENAYALRRDNFGWQTIEGCEV